MTDQEQRCGECEWWTRLTEGTFSDWHQFGTTSPPVPHCLTHSGLLMHESNGADCPNFKRREPAATFPHFSRDQFTCPGAPDDFPLCDRLRAWDERIRAACGGWPIHVNSGYRTPEYNATLPGHSDISRHMLGCANDLGVNAHVNAQELFAAAWLTIDRTRPAGLGLYRWGIHIDTDPARPAIDMWHGDPRRYKRFPLKGETT